MASIPSESRRLKSSKKSNKKKPRRIGKKKINLSKWIHDEELLTSARNRLIEKCERYSIITTDPDAVRPQLSVQSGDKMQNPAHNDIDEDNPSDHEGVERIPMSSKLSQSVKSGSHLSCKHHSPNEMAKAENEEKAEVTEPETTYEGEDEAERDEQIEKIPAPSPSPMCNDCEGHDTNSTTKTAGPIFESVNQMEMSMHIKGSKLEETLCRFERCLVSKKAKKSIPRHCLFCKKSAPKKYPKDVYICNDHRKGLVKELEEHHIVIPKKRCTVEAKENCITLQQSYQQILKSLKTDDQKSDQSMFPKNYFSTTMAKLLHCQRGLNALSPDQIIASKVRNEARKMRKIVKQLMDLLIVIRQSMNPVWVWICALLTTVASIIACSVAWMIAQSAFITVLAGFLAFFVGVMIGGVICGDRNLKFVCGSGAVGVAGGIVAGGVGTALLVTKEGSEIGAMIGTACGGPGAGTAAGAFVGGLVGGVFGLGAAAMYTYWPGQESEDEDEDDDDPDTEGEENALLNEQNYF